MRKLLLWLLLALIVAGCVLELVGYVAGWHSGPFHAPTDDGYWGGV